MEGEHKIFFNTTIYEIRTGWRECGNKNTDHTHIFSTCPRIQPYWKNVIGLIKEILKIDVTIEQHTIILGIQPRTLRQQHLSFFFILRTSAIKQITKKLKKFEIPTVKKWLQTVEEMYEMEKVTYKITKKEKLFEKRWEPFQLSKKKKWHLVRSYTIGGKGVGMG